MIETGEETPRAAADRPGGGATTQDAPHDPGPGLREYLAALRRYWWLALVTFLVVLAVSVGSLFLIDPVYRTEAEVLVRSEDSRQLFPRTTGSSGNALIRSPRAELAYVQGDAFRRLAAEAARDDAEVEVSNPLESSALVFRAEAGDPEVAQDAAQAWADSYVAARHESDVRETTALRDLLVADRDALRKQQGEILRPVAVLDVAVAAETDPVELSRLLNQRLAVQRSLDPELEPVQTELRRLDTQISSLDVDLRVLEDPAALAYVTRAAEVPEERANGSMTQSLLVGVVAGLVLAGGAVAAAWSLRRR